mgnify:CR=1 FL=1
MGHVPVSADLSAAALYQWLLDRQACCNIFDAHVFACVLSHRLPLGMETMGLTPQAMNRLLARYFPTALADGLPWSAAVWGDVQPPPLPPLLAAEVADLTALMLEHRAQGTEDEEWLAAMIARACLDTVPLWMALGLPSRRDLNALMRRHFPVLSARNDGSQGWRPFLYRLLCLDSGLIPCGNDRCTDCGAGHVCLGWVEW